MFLLVSGRHVGAHPDGHQDGVSIQISVNLGKKFIRISCIRKIAVTWILARVFAYLLSFFSQNLDFIYWTVLIFILIYFEWCDTEKQQLKNWNLNTVCSIFFFGGGSSPKMTAIRGGPCEKIGKLRGGHAIFKWCFLNPTSPPSLIKNERSLKGRTFSFNEF